MRTIFKAYKNVCIDAEELFEVNYDWLNSEALASYCEDNNISCVRNYFGYVSHIILPIGSVITVDSTEGNQYVTLHCDILSWKRYAPSFVPSAYGLTRILKAKELNEVTEFDRVLLEKLNGGTL